MSKKTLYFLISALLIIVLGIVITLVSARDKQNQDSQRKDTPINSAVADETLDKLANEITDNDVALALLAEDEIALATSQQDQIRSAPVEFNDHLEEETWDYLSFVARLTYHRATALPFVENAVTRHPSRQAAQDGMVTKAGNFKRITLDETFGDKSLAYFIPASEGQSAGLAVRFSYGIFSAKVVVYDIKPVLVLSDAESEIPDDELIAGLKPLASSLAKKQLKKVQDLYSGNLRYTKPTESSALTRLPRVLPNATYVGEAKVTANEWFGFTRELDKKSLPGFQSGGIVRFNIDNRQGESVEVILLEFDEPLIPQEYVKNFVASGGDRVEEVSLPQNIDPSSEAILQDTGVELQSVQGNYLMDISVFSPFGVIDREAATEDSLAITDYYLKNFFGLPSEL